MKCGIIVICILFGLMIFEMFIFSFLWIRAYWNYISHLKKNGYRIPVPNPFINDFQKIKEPPTWRKIAFGEDDHRINGIKARSMENLFMQLSSNRYKGPTIHDNPYQLTNTQCKNTTEAITLCDFYNKLEEYQPLLNKHQRKFLSWLSPADQILRKKYSTCAIVTSAGALLGSQHGAFIDNHELVVRFNNAPTDGYEPDVGSRTSVRVLNSQILSNERFNFLNSSLYRNITLLVWDPAKNTSSLKEWIDKPEHEFVDAYKKYRRKYNSENIHLFDPSFMWRLWYILHCDTNGKIKYHPPSSGFLALSFLIPRCGRIRMFEYMPSKITNRCHYYSNKMDKYCTYGTWHPLAAEKLFAYRINTALDQEVFLDSYIGFDQGSIEKCKTKHNNESQIK